MSGLFDTLPPARKPQEPVQRPASAYAFPHPRPATPRRPDRRWSVTRDDMIAREVENAALAAELERWADASDSRAERMRSGPLFGGKE